MIRKSWFIERIGKTIFRNSNGCDCSTCERILTQGLVIGDEFHATYLYDSEFISNQDGSNLRYFDTPEEVKEWEKESKWSV